MLLNSQTLSSFLKNSTLPKKLYFILSFLFFVVVFSCSPTKKNPPISIDEKIDSLISIGHLSELFVEPDTLNMTFYLSGCMNRRYDLVSFVKKNDTLFVSAEIRFKLNKEDTTLCETVKYNLAASDSLSFENLLINIYNQQSLITDSTEYKYVFMSMGVHKKWGRKCFLDKNDISNSRFFHFYNGIMHIIYPETDYFNIPVLYFVEEDVDIAG